MGKNFYITTTLPYVNADPHLGFALEIVQADVVARYHRLIGDNVIFNFGTDEHGQKIYQNALEENKNPKDYVDEYAAKFNKLKKALNLSYTNFIRTTDEYHIKAAQKFWELCKKNGDIYKKKYKSKYCVGCELEKTDSELVDGKCPLHPNKEIEIIEEENYFFRFSKYQTDLIKFYETHPDFVIPNFRFNEIKQFVKNGINDFSISRLKEKMPWGIEVPDDPDHVMYVWFDALINYISTLGWPNKNIDNFWPGIQVCGKDNLRQQTAIWQAMLISAKIPNTKQVFIHGFISLNGQKMSKSEGNVVYPDKLVKKYGTDSVRYYLLAHVHPTDDSDFTMEKFENAYTANLANGLGNLVSRVTAMAQNYKITSKSPNKLSINVENNLLKYRFDKALNNIWDNISASDSLINKTEVWKLTGDKKTEILTDLINQIRQISYDLIPFLPDTSESINKQLSLPKIIKNKPLFPRLN